MSEQDQKRAIAHQYSSVRELRFRFQTELDSAAKSGDIAKALELKSQLEAELGSLRETVAPAERLINLREQYNLQYQLLADGGFLDNFNDGSFGLIDMLGLEHKFPTVEEIISKMRENSAVVNKKVHQGFTKLLIVPFGLSIEELAKKYIESLREHDDRNNEFILPKDSPDAQNKTVSLSVDELLLPTDDPLIHGDSTSRIKYQPQGDSITITGGTTKMDILNSGSLWSGWNVLLVNDDPFTPKVGSSREVSGRKPIENSSNVGRFLTQVGNDQYSHEQGYTIEDWLFHSMTHLKEKNELMDVAISKNGRIEGGNNCVLLNNAIRHSERPPESQYDVLKVGWSYRDNPDVNFIRLNFNLEFQSPASTIADAVNGIRTAVNIGKL